VRRVLLPCFVLLFLVFVELAEMLLSFEVQLEDVLGDL